GGSTTLEYASCRKYQRSMAELGYGFLAVEEVPNNAHAMRIVTDVLGRTSAGYHQSQIIGRINIGKGDVGVPTVSWLFCVGIEAGLEIVHYKVQLLLCGSCDVNLVSFFSQTLIGIHDFQRFSCIAGEDQNFGSRHRAPPGLILPHFRVEDLGLDFAHDKS